MEQMGTKVNLNGKQWEQGRQRGTRMESMGTWEAKGNEGDKGNKGGKRERGRQRGTREAKGNEGHKGGTRIESTG